MRLDEPAADLSVAAAVASSLRNRPVRRVHGRIRRDRPGRRGPGHHPGRPAGARGCPAGLQAVYPASREHRSGRPDAGRRGLRAHRGLDHCRGARRAARIIRSSLVHTRAIHSGGFGHGVVRTRPCAVPCGGDLFGHRRSGRSTRTGLPNAAFGVGLASCWSSSKSRLKNTSVTNMLGAMLGGAIGLAASPRRSARRSSGPTPATSESPSCTRSRCSR